MNFDIKNFTTEIICENEVSDAAVSFEYRENELDLYLTATADRPKFIKLCWAFPSDENTLVLADVWERSYGDLAFRKINEAAKYAAWYFLATNKKESLGFGIKTGANSFVSFDYNTDGITALVDVRNGGDGVHLNGRTVHLATFVRATYENGDVFGALKDYCKKLCDKPCLPKERIYGGNNWYYAYGDSSYEQIIADAKLQVELAKGIDNKPFEVIDDCWQLHSCEGPWLPNEKFGDMKKLAAEIKELGARPGIWFRPLRDRYTDFTDEMRILRNGTRNYLDPTHPTVQAHIRADVERIKEWGYELVKHDFTTADLFGDYGGNLDKTITNYDDWHFYDQTKTNAEVVLDLYRLIREAAGDMLIIGCNTFSHLSAGLFEIYRTGNDTSGREWQYTKENGVNTLAFRLAQNEAFYMCDADCVGILEDRIPWERNGQWLKLLSYSNTPLFVSCNNSITDEMRADLSKAYQVFNQPHDIEPIDIYESKTPSRWMTDGEMMEYDWDC